jgi:hypothetical protein
LAGRELSCSPSYLCTLKSYTENKMALAIALSLSRLHFLKTFMSLAQATHGISMYGMGRRKGCYHHPSSPFVESNFLEGKISSLSSFILIIYRV